MTDSYTTTSNELQVAQIDIGELLSSKRHQLRKSLDEVSKSLKLSVDVLEKLESARFADIGTPVYVRGYLGLYAKHLELDTAHILEQYNQQNPGDNVTIRPSAGHNFGNTRQQRKRHSKTLSFLVVGLVVAGLVYGYSQMESVVLQKAAQTDDSVIELDGGIDNTTADNNSDDTGIDAVLGEVDEAQNLANDVLNGESINTSSSGLVTDIDLGLALPSTTTTTAETVQPANSETAANNNTANATANANAPDATADVSTPSSAETTGQNSADSASNETIAQANEDTHAEPAETKPTEARLRMAFSDECWIKVSDASGKTLIGQVYKKGEKLNVKVKLPMTLVVGNARFVTSASMDNKAIKLADYKISRQRYRFE